MRLYEINAELQTMLDNIDPETGELNIDWAQYEALNLAREEKLEGVALAIKNMAAEAEAIKLEEKRLSERRAGLEKRAERAKVFLKSQLDGEQLKTARVAVGYRKTESVELTNDFMVWARETGDYLRYKDPEPDKVAIKAALKQGTVIPGAALVQNTSMTIK